MKRNFLMLTSLFALTLAYFSYCIPVEAKYDETRDYKDSCTRNLAYTKYKYTIRHDKFENG